MEVKDIGCRKIKLPNGKVADVLSPVLEEIEKWIQDTSYKPESGGYIIGYQHKVTGNYSLETVTSPYVSVKFFRKKGKEIPMLLYLISVSINILIGVMSILVGIIIAL